jgi:hypothetical protein
MQGGHSFHGEPPLGALLVTVHVLEETGRDGEICWAARDGRSLGDRILLLGSPASFTMDAAQLGMAGGCAYFISWLGMFSYNLITGEAKLVELMRPGWGANFTWLSPQPTIAPIQELKQKTRR